MARTQCPICFGSGKITEWKNGKRTKRECPECGGLGYVQPDWYDSHPPQEKGRTPKEATL